MSILINTTLVKEMILHLHRYGASADRIEGAVSEVATRLGLNAQVMASATGAWLSVIDPTDPERPITHILRLSPGSVDLGKLCDADMIAEQVGRGEITSEEALSKLRELDQPDKSWENILTLFCCAAASGAVPALFAGTGYIDLFASWGLGFLAGCFFLLAGKFKRFGEASEALVAFFVALTASLIHHFLAPLSMNVVVVAGLIALMPGLSLTTAVAELSSGQLTAGMARLGGSLVVLVKLTLGTVLAFGVVKFFGLSSGKVVERLSTLPETVRTFALLAGAFSFAGLFKAKKEHAFLVAGSVLTGHFIAQFVQGESAGMLGMLPTGILVSGIFITLLSNIFSTFFHRPGAVIRLPGIIMLVPGSIGFKAGQSLWSDQLSAGGDLFMLAFATVVALLAGILIGNMIWRARRL